MVARYQPPAIASRGLRNLGLRPGNYLKFTGTLPGIYPKLLELPEIYLEFTGNLPEITGIT